MTNAVITLKTLLMNCVASIAVYRNYMSLRVKSLFIQCHSYKPTSPFERNFGFWAWEIGVRIGGGEKQVVKIVAMAIQPH